jgi:predicted dinucleotide-binding enzyme
MAKVAVLGAGRVGTSIARAAIGAGYDVDIAASGSPDRIALTIEVLVPGAHATTAAEAVVGAHFVVLAVPMHKFRSVDPAILAGRVVVDVMNYWEPNDGHQPEFADAAESSSEIVQAAFPDSLIVKSLNHLGYHELEEDARPAGASDRRAIAVAGDDHHARDLVLAFIDRIGFDPVDAGPLANGVVLQPGYPVFGAAHSAEELREALRTTAAA